jgi:NAD(P)-dependent dehydrogenase (short-subunit alcohol dehydrogenase family)
MPNNILEGKRVIVTGASSGIGAAIAIRFASEGASVWAAGGTNEVGLKSTLDACANAPGKISGKSYDLSDSHRGIEVVKEGVEFLGGLDILVNCAAARKHKAFLEFTPEEVDMLFEINAKSVFYASIEAAKVMVPQKSGRILMIGSIDGQRGVPGNALYCTTKTAMHNLTRALAAELGPHGIRVNCLAPGTTESPRVKQIHEDRPDFAKSKLPKIPVQRFAAPEEMASVSLFLVSDENDFMNGAIIPCDGGTTAL